MDSKKMWSAPKGNRLTDQESAFLRLIQRSPGDSEGWRTVSASLWKWATTFPRADLLELEAFPEGGGRMRLSADGLIVLRYV